MILLHVLTQFWLFSCDVIRVTFAHITILPQASMVLTIIEPVNVLLVKKSLTSYLPQSACKSGCAS